MKHIIYQVLPRLWRTGKFSAWDDGAFNYLKSLSVDCIWFTGIIRHASGEPFVKGDPGSPYAIYDYYDVNPYLADNEDKRMDEFKQLVSRCHEHGFKVIIDFVPNHVAVNCINDLPLFDWHDYDWSDTRKINYSAQGAWEKMRSVVQFWVDKGIDGLRCDMIELVDSVFFKYLTDSIKAQKPDFLFIGEAYQKDNYRKYLSAGFDLLYDKCGLYDSLRAIESAHQSARCITWNWQGLGDIQPHMLNFLENHDEERQYITTNASRAVSALFNTASFMLYFGQEIGEMAADSDNNRTSIFNWVRKIDPLGHISATQQDCLTNWRKLLSLASSPDFAEGGNWDLNYCQQNFNPDNVFAFLREKYLVVCNFSPINIEGDILIPAEAKNECHPYKDSIHVRVSAGDALVTEAFTN